jgi:hypothetical protein
MLASFDEERLDLLISEFAIELDPPIMQSEEIETDDPTRIR